MLAVPVSSSLITTDGALVFMRRLAWMTLCAMVALALWMLPSLSRSISPRRDPEPSYPAWKAEAVKELRRLRAPPAEGILRRGELTRRYSADARTQQSRARSCRQQRANRLRSIRSLMQGPQSQVLRARASRQISL